MNKYEIVKNTEWKEVEINGENKQIPSAWQYGLLINHLDFQEGPGILAKDFRKSGVPLLRIESIKGVETSFNGCDYLDNEMVQKKWSHFRIKENDILLSASGTLGVISKVKKEQEGAIVYTGIIRFRAKEGTQKKFVPYLLKSDLVLNKLKKEANSSILSHFGPKDLKILDISLPPLSQQSAIAEILSEQEAVIENIEQLIKKYESRFQYLSDNLLSGKLRVKEENGETIIYKNPEDNYKEVEINGEMKEIPKDWEIDKLKNHITVINGYAFPKTKMLNEKVESSFPIIKIGNIFDNTIIDNSGTGQNYYLGEIKDSFVPQFNDLIVGLSGANAGKTGIYKLKIKTVLNQRNAIVRIKSNILTQDFFNYFWFKDALNTLKETTKDSAIPNISSEDIENIDVFILTKQEQKIISALLNKQEEIISKQKNILGKEKERFNWLLENLLSGQYLIKEL